MGLAYVIGKTHVYSCGAWSFKNYGGLYLVFGEGDIVKEHEVSIVEDF